jgi:hypothetical protein
MALAAEQRRSYCTLQLGRMAGKTMWDVDAAFGRRYPIFTAS